MRHKFLFITLFLLLTTTLAYGQQASIMNEDASVVRSAEDSVGPLATDRFGQAMEQAPFSGFLNGGNDTAETGSTTTNIVATAHAVKAGDWVMFGVSSTARGGMGYVTSIATNSFTIAPPLRAAPNNGDFFYFGRSLAPQLDNQGGVVVVPKSAGDGSPLIQQEDAGHTSGDRGIMALGVLTTGATAAYSSGSTNGDYEPPAIDANTGGMLSTLRSSGWSADPAKSEDTGVTDGQAVIAMGAMRSDTVQTNSGTGSDSEWSYLYTNNSGGLYTQPVSGASGGATFLGAISGASNNSTNVKASAGNLSQIVGCNINAAVRWLKVYNKASAPTCGTDTPVLRIPLPVNNCVNIPFPVGMQFSAGIGYCIVTGAADSDNTSTAANEQTVTVVYK